MIGIILALLAGVGMLFAIPGFFMPIGSGIGESFIILARGIVYVMIIALPAITAIAIFYIVLSKDTGKDKMNMLAIGALYGIALYLIMVNFGLLDMALNYFRSITGSWIGSWGANWVTGVSAALITVFLFLEGLALAFLDKLIWTLLHLREWLHGIVQRAKRFNKKFT